MQGTIKIGSRSYHVDTERAKTVAHRTEGSFGDPAGYEETLYQMPNRIYFIAGKGGSASPYPAESVKAATPAARHVFE